MRLFEVIETFDAVPYEKNNDIRKLIHKGAFDSQIVWTSAMELVNAAYRTAGVDRPTPAMSNAWNQYEDNIQYAVAQLTKSTENYIRGNEWKTLPK